MGNTFTIDSIWIEFEFRIPNHISEIIWPIQDFVDWYNSKNEDFTIEVDREYYSDQIEFKLRRTNLMKEWIEYFQNFLKLMYITIPWLKCTTNNHFVWCHIHYFINKDWEHYQNFAQWKKISLVRMAYVMMADWIQSANKKWMLNRVRHNEINRLVRNHNILRYFDQSIWDRLRANLESSWMSYQQFHSWTDKPKYTPVLWSLANISSWKPHSLEVRCIPNTFFLLANSDEVLKIWDWIEEILNMKWHIDDSKNIEIIVDKHLSLVNALR